MSLTTLEVRNNIVNRLQEAVKLSNIHPAMADELEGIRVGVNPRDVIGLRWSDLLLGRFDQKPMDDLVAIFNELA